MTDLRSTANMNRLQISPIATGKTAVQFHQSVILNYRDIACNQSINK